MAVITALVTLANMYGGGNFGANIIGAVFMALSTVLTVMALRSFLSAAGARSDVLKLIAKKEPVAESRSRESLD
ncbi:hypothetical protein [Micromonospora sp. NBC_01412]|uniref:hypothetical protein n=1 Tax=Micromonospora sp. NBC_01412 TaxID=2903590 RepID=UPI00325386FB